MPQSSAQAQMGRRLRNSLSGRDSDLVVPRRILNINCAPDSSRRGAAARRLRHAAHNDVRGEGRPHVPSTGQQLRPPGSHPRALGGQRSGAPRQADTGAGGAGFLPQAPGQPRVPGFRGLRRRLRSWVWVLPPAGPATVLRPHGVAPTCSPCYLFSAFSAPAAPAKDLRDGLGPLGPPRILSPSFKVSSLTSYLSILT